MEPQETRRLLRETQRMRRELRKRHLTTLAAMRDDELRVVLQRGLSTAARWRSNGARGLSSIDAVRAMAEALDAGEELRRRAARRETSRAMREIPRPQRLPWTAELIAALRPIAAIERALTEQDPRYFTDEQRLILGRGISLRMGDLRVLRRLLSKLERLQPVEEYRHA